MEGKPELVDRSGANCNSYLLANWQGVLFSYHQIRQTPREKDAVGIYWNRSLWGKVCFMVDGGCLSFLWSIYAPRGVVKWANYMIILFYAPMGEE